MEASKVLVTGGAGFIGYHTSRRLAQLGHQVVMVDNMDSYYSPIIKNDRIHEICKHYFVKFRYGDITKAQELDHIFKNENFDYVIHLAAKPGPKYSSLFPNKTYEHNIMGHLAVLQACKDHGVKKVIYSSSSSVYGGNNSAVNAESDFINVPLSHYGISKRVNEMTADVFSEQHQLPIIGIRPHTVYGPWGRPDMAVYKFTEQIINDCEVECFGTNTSRDFTYVDDVVESILALLQANTKGHLIVNVGKGESIPVTQLIDVIAKSVGKRAKVKNLPLPNSEPSTTLCNNSLLTQLTGYTPIVGIEEGVERFVKWYKNKNKI